MELRTVIAAAVALAPAFPLVAAGPACADEPPLLALPPPSTTIAQADVAAPDPQPTDATATTSIGSYFDNWFNRVDAARESQPHWAAPLITTTPLLVEQLRADVYYESLGNGAHVLNLGGGKGLELIPTTSNEIFIAIPPYQERYGVKPADGFTDWQFLLLKQRLLSANEQNGDYVVTAFLSVQAPIGITAFTNNAYVITSTLGAGKGFGNFAIQATTGLALPTNHADTLGTPWATNVAFQYRIAKVFTPEVEVNWTQWLDGTQRGSKNQVFLTVGAVLGTFHFTDRLGLVVGAGYQFAVGPLEERKPVLTPVYRNNWIFSARLPF
jgi:hypothetical protein